jgi:hypothetical protein
MKYCIADFEKRMLSLGVIPTYNITVGPEQYDEHRMCVKRAEGFVVPVPGKLIKLRWNEKGECFTCNKQRTRVSSYDLFKQVRNN